MWAPAGISPAAHHISGIPDDGLGCHFATLLCTAPTSFRALATVLHLRVLLTLSATGLAHLCTDATKCCRQLTVSRHRTRCQLADLSAVDVEGDTAGHRFRITLLQTGHSAGVAGLGTGITGVDTGAKLLGRHMRYCSHHQNLRVMWAERLLVLTIGRHAFNPLWRLSSAGPKHLPRPQNHCPRNERKSMHKVHPAEQAPCPITH